MELNIRNGDYVPDGTGRLQSCGGGEEVLARVLFKLTARRGTFPFLPELGSRLYTVMREKPAFRQALAAQYVEEALREERDVKVTGVDWQEKDEQGILSVYLEWKGEQLTAALNLT